MPEYCCVPFCKERSGGHSFPKDCQTRQKWRVAIKRLDQTSKKLWEPTASSVICKKHFTPDDYKSSLLGERPRLKPGVVPSIFPFASKLTKVPRRDPRRKDFGVNEPEFENGVECRKEEVWSISDAIQTDNKPCTNNNKVHSSEQCEILTSFNSAFSIEKFESNHAAIQYYTGFEDIGHFHMFFNVLGLAVDHLNYQCLSVSPKNQLFITLMKLRQAKDDIELSILFKINERTATKIFNTWINFMYFQLKEIDIHVWPSKEIVKYTMPSDFKSIFPNTRVILDATETPIQKPGDVNDQMATFSSYKHKITVKTMIGITPRGAVSYISDSYGGSASDRQIIERSVLINKDHFEAKDSIMADKGILVQDLFCSKDVSVNTPTVLKGKSQLEPFEVVHDRRVASKRIHVERVIGLSKTYKILKKDLIPSKLQISSRIVFVCFSLSNFRNNIVGQFA